MKHAAAYNDREASRALMHTVDACRLSNPVLYPVHYASDHARHVKVMPDWAEAENVYNGESCVYDTPVTMHYVVGLSPDTITALRILGDDVTDNWRMVTCAECLDGKHRP